MKVKLAMYYACTIIYKIILIIRLSFIVTRNITSRANGHTRRQLKLNALRRLNACHHISPHI